MHVIYYLYALETCDVVVRDTHVYMYVSVQKINHADSPLLSSILGWYEPPQTTIIYFYVFTL